MTNSNSNTNTE